MSDEQPGILGMFTGIIDGVFGFKDKVSSVGTKIGLNKGTHKFYNRNQFDGF